MQQKTPDINTINRFLCSKLGFSSSGEILEKEHINLLLEHFKSAEEMDIGFIESFTGKRCHDLAKAIKGRRC